MHTSIPEPTTLTAVVRFKNGAENVYKCDECWQKQFYKRK